MSRWCVSMGVPLRPSNLRRGLSLRRGFVLSLVHSELAPASEENKDRDQYRRQCAKEGGKRGGEERRGDEGNAPTTIVPVFAPFVRRDPRWTDQILVIESYTCGHEGALATRWKFRRVVYGGLRGRDHYGQYVALCMGAGRVII